MSQTELTTGVEERKTIQQEMVAAAPPHEEHCTNCGAFAPRRYCPECGQETTAKITALKPLVLEFLNEFASVDSKLAHTFAALLFHPGRLTKDYIEGRRIRYIAPIRLYVLTSALFVLASTIGHDKGVEELTKLLLIVAPMLAFLLTLLHWRSRRYYIEHLIFALHAQAFACLLGALVYPSTWLISYFTHRSIRSLVVPLMMSLLVWMLAYVLFALKKVYQQSWGKTLLKFAGLSGFYILLYVGIRLLFNLR
jgi:hypothetical protein